MRVKYKQKDIAPEGVEPSTLGLLDPRSNQLSYGAVLWAQRVIIRLQN